MDKLILEIMTPMQLFELTIKLINELEMKPYDF